MTTHLLELREQRVKSWWFASSIGLKRFTFVHVPIKVAEMGDKYTSKGKILHKREFKSGYGNELLRKKLEVFFIFWLYYALWPVINKSHKNSSNFTHIKQISFVLN